MRVTLNDMTVRNLKPTGKQQKYLCNRTPGFGLMVSQAGGKSFFLTLGKERKRIHLGKYPSTSLAEARRKAGQLHTAPSTQLSYNEASELYLQTYVRPNYRPRSAKEVERLLAKLLSKSEQLTDISTRHITDVLDKLPPSEANHTFGVLRTFFGWAFRRDLISVNPLSKLCKPHKEKSRDRVLTPDEIRAVWTATEEPTPFNVIIRLALLTGQRRGELAAMQQSWLSSTPAPYLGTTSSASTSAATGSSKDCIGTGEAAANPCLTFPKEVTKNKKEHCIPITALTARLVHTLTKCLSGTSTYNTWSKPQADLLKRAGTAHFTIHDLRRTCSSNLGGLAIAPHIIDRLLNHTTNSLHARYNRYQYMDEMRDALCAWEKRLLDIVASTD